MRGRYTRVLTNPLCYSKRSWVLRELAHKDFTAHFMNAVNCVCNKYILIQCLFSQTFNPSLTNPGTDSPLRQSTVQQLTICQLKGLISALLQSIIIIIIEYNSKRKRRELADAMRTLTEYAFGITQESRCVSDRDQSSTYLENRGFQDKRSMNKTNNLRPFDHLKRFDSHTNPIRSEGNIPSKRRLNTSTSTLRPAYTH